MLKDIKSERPKITEKDHLRLLFVTRWFLEFFLSLRTTDKSRTWGFGLIAEVTERNWIVWVLKRMREAVNEKVCYSSLYPTPNHPNIPQFFDSRNSGPNFKLE